MVDHGPGVAPESASTMFTPFQRLGDRNTASGIGGGLYNNSGTATLTGVTLVNNKATTFGGGIAATGAAVTPAATTSNSPTIPSSR